MSRPQDIQGLIDAGEARPDLSTPTLAGLSYMLRHRELWPASFEWHYIIHTCCAMGLADRLWDIKCHKPFATSLDMVRAFGVPMGWATKVFIYQTGATPSRIADLIDQYLAAKQ